MDFLDRIFVDPTVRFGKPCVRGTRLTVGDVLGYLAGGMTEADVLADFPQLTREDLRACYAFAAERERRLMVVPAAQHAAGVRLLFDENLSARLVPALTDVYPGSAHLADVGLLGAPDGAVWDHAAVGGHVLVTKDEDFQRLSMLRGPPPKVVWIRLGNCATADVARLLRLRYDAVSRLVADPEATFLALG